MRRKHTQTPATKPRKFLRAAAEKVAELRTRRGWSQERLADKAHLSARTIQNLESGNFTHPATIARVAEALGASITDCIAAGHAGSMFPAADALPAHCPYRGLLAFQEEDAGLFFGRESLVELLREKIKQKPILQVSGPSGSGKSSLIAAGLVPALKRSDSWQVLYCRPGADPFESIASAFTPELEPDLDEISRAERLPKLRGVLEGGQLSYLLKQVFVACGSRGLLLLIDQFEELYTHCSSQHVRDGFLDALSSLVGVGHVKSGPGVRVLYTIRADFVNRLLSHRRFTDAIQDADVKIGPMTREELDSAIRRPAARYSVEFEDGLPSAS
ncbi:MAG: helix-turn-helix transcriptional regulator [Acidobacteriaceae bacterium]|nr:helix-turn-helix transcriptional regulator [Acidobacteriaceae bacterium]